MKKSPGKGERTMAVIQARSGSSRLPRKALIEIAGKAMILHVIDRARATPGIDDVVVATTESDTDDALARLVESTGTAVFRGSELDVLDRTYRAVEWMGAHTVVRVTADDPLKDPATTALVIARLRAAGADYASNTLVPTYPEGVDIEAFTFAALARAWSGASLPSEREHVTPYLWKHPERFRLVSVEHDVDLSAQRWTVDYPEDLEFIRGIYGALYHGSVFGMVDVLRLLEQRPDLAHHGRLVARNEGYERSLQHEATERGKPRGSAK